MNTLKALMFTIGILLATLITLISGYVLYLLIIGTSIFILFLVLRRLFTGGSSER